MSSTNDMIFHNIYGSNFVSNKSTSIKVAVFFMLKSNALGVYASTRVLMGI